MGRIKNCCCFSAQTGTLILGFLGIFFSVSGLITSSVAYNNKVAIDEWIKNWADQHGNAPSIDQAEDFMRWMAPHVAASFIVDNLIDLAVSIALIYGVNEGKPVWFLPWLILRGIALFVWSILAFATFVSLCMVSVGQGFLALIIVLGPLTLVFYFLYFMVHSVYQDVKEGVYPGANIRAMTV